MTFTKTEIETINSLSSSLRKDLSKDFKVDHLTFYEKFDDKENIYCSISFEIKIPEPVSTDKIAVYVFNFWDNLRQNLKLEME